MKSIYLSFLALVDALQGEVSEMSTIDLEAKRLLEVIAIQHNNNEPLKVMDAMRLDSIASPATIHRKLQQLEKAGLITMVHMGTNRRKKYLIPTPAAQTFFEQASKAMTQAMAAH